MHNQGNQAMHGEPQLGKPGSAALPADMADSMTVLKELVEMPTVAETMYFMQHICLTARIE